MGQGRGELPLKNLICHTLHDTARPQSPTLPSTGAFQKRRDQRELTRPSIHRTEGEESSQKWPDQSTFPRPDLCKWQRPCSHAVGTTATARRILSKQEKLEGIA